MATVYASLVSLLNLLIRMQHPSCPASFDQLQIQSLSVTVSYLIDFIEDDDKYRTGKLTEGLASRITDAVLSAEALIESYIVDQINAKAEGTRGMFYDLFCQNLQKSIQETGSIMEDVIKIKDVRCENDDNWSSSFSKTVDSLRSSGQDQEKTMVGFEEEMKHLLELLTDDQYNRQIIPIVGMGGIGKTTLATNVYKHPRILRCFHSRGWVTVSQNFSVRKIVLSLLQDLNVHSDKDDISDSEIGTSIEELGDKLYKCLSGTKYLIVLDDIWSSKVWDEVQMFLPDNNNRSRILLCTRMLNVGVAIGGSTCSPCEMKFLDLDKSWDLLSQTVFGHEMCPLELENHGKKISKSCKGLPLAIVVIGGLLKNSQMTREYWVQIAKKVYSIMDIDNNDYCLNILSLSYHHLPIHLKPCFLSMQSFRKGTQFKVTTIVNGWIVNGILKPDRHKSFEEVALDYLNDLIDRNIIVVKVQAPSNGRKRRCSLHNMFVDFGRREVKNERFSCRVRSGKLYHPNKMSGNQHLDTSNATYSVCPGLPISKSVAFSFKSESYTHDVKLLRVLTSHCEDSLQTILQLYNARYLRSTKCCLNGNSRYIPSSISFLWNLDTLVVNASSSDAVLILPSEIWELPHLRHLEITDKVILSDPVGARVDCFLHSLHKLTTIKNFMATNEVIKRIPNLTKLGICYNMLEEESQGKISRCFSNLVHLEKLEKLKCRFDYGYRMRKCFVTELETLTLPHALIKLSLFGSYIPWGSMSIVGSLPNLEVLLLQHNAFFGKEWISNEGEFQRLKYLSIKVCFLETWHADSCYFPQLERLDLDLVNLKEIPRCIGEVSTLVSLNLTYCYASAIISAKEILEEHQSLGNNDLLVRVTPYPWDCHSEVMNLADDSFQIRIPTLDLSNKKTFDMGFYKLQSMRLYSVFRQAPDLAIGDRALEEIISDISNDIFKVIDVRCSTSEITPDFAVRFGTSIIDAIIQLHNSFHKNAALQEFKVVPQHNDSSYQIIMFMKNKIIQNIESHARSAIKYGSA